MKPVMFLTLATLMLNACGKENAQASNEAPKDRPAATTKAKRGHLQISVTKMTTEEQANGLLRNCIIDFKIENKTGASIKRIRMAFRPEVSDEFDSQVHGAAGKQSLYFRNIAKGQSTSRSQIRSIGCEGLTALNILDSTCSLENGPCAPGTVHLDGGSFFKINMP